jgi:hypothetical protein
LFHAVFLLGLFFDPADVGDMFLRNVDCLSTDYTAIYPRKKLHNHRRAKLMLYRPTLIRNYFSYYRISQGIQEAFRYMAYIQNY